MEIHFTKLQGNGNDFILIDEVEGPSIPDEMKGKFAMLYCHRRFGIGADGILFFGPTDRAAYKMRLFQPDESEAEMCGNGIRCVAKYAYDNGYVKEKGIFETLAGDITVEMRYEEDEFLAQVEMPTPVFERSGIPAEGEGEYVEEIGGYTVHAVGIGVPHAVIIVEEIGGIDIEKYGPMIRNHPTFPEGANVNFVEIASENEVHIRTFERGVEAETLSCGTGAAASAALAHHLGHVGAKVTVITKGGRVVVDLEDGTKMEGPATTVFTGTIPF